MEYTRFMYHDGMTALLSFSVSGEQTQLNRVTGVFVMFRCCDLHLNNVENTGRFSKLNKTCWKCGVDHGRAASDLSRHLYMSTGIAGG